MTAVRENVKRRFEIVQALAVVVLHSARDKRGQAMVEYALIIALLTTVALVGLKLIPAFPIRAFNSAVNAFP